MKTDLEKLIEARKFRTHCQNWTVDEVLDELIALDKKYGPLTYNEHEFTTTPREVEKAIDESVVDEIAVMRKKNDETD